VGLDDLEQRGQDDESGPRVHRLNDGLESGKSGILDGSGLVGKSFEESRERGGLGVGDDVGLKVSSGAILAQGRDGRSSGFSHIGGLLVTEGLSQVSQNLSRGRVTRETCSATRRINVKIWEFFAGWRGSTAALQWVEDESTHLEDRITESDLSQKLDTLLLGGGGEGDSGLVSGSLVGDEKGGGVESTGLGGGASGSSSGSHHGFYSVSRVPWATGLSGDRIDVP
jgi:hypothetical protein